MNYTEDVSRSQASKQQYWDGLNRILEQKKQQAEQTREAYFRNFFNDPEAYRRDFRNMLGWPLVNHEEADLPTVTEEFLAQEAGYRIYRLRFEILDGLPMTGLFFRADGEEKKPLVIVQHGGEGTPELISGFYGSTANYNDMLHRVRAQGVHVFAPQFLLWHDRYEVPFDRKALDAKLKRVGSSITAIEVYGITRILDYFEAQSFVSSFGMVGLSYGGFYTLYAAAIDTRIQAAISCAFFNKRDADDRSDWTWFHSGETFDDAQVACLIYPRQLCIEIGAHDRTFDCQFGIASYETLKHLCQSVGTDWLDFIVFDGNHEFHKDDQPIYRLVQTLRTTAI